MTPDPDLGALPRCWGIGLGRTGTTTLCEALRLLGYSPVKHDPDFSDFPSLHGASEWAPIVYFKYLDFRFPGSKFVLTLRDREVWLQSMEYMFTRYPVRSMSDDRTIMRRTMVLGTVTFDRQKFIYAWDRHVDDVRQHFRDRPESLLEMNITSGDGWDILCPFLGAPIPSVPFPRLNDRTRHAGETAN